MKRQTRPSAASRTPRSLSETQIEALEPRILFSGAPVEAPDAPLPPAETATSPEQPGLIGEATGSDQEDAPTVSGTTPVALVETGAASGSLNAGTLEAIAAAARQRWIDSGLSAEQVAALDAVRYEIADLGGYHLGKANGYTVTIDDDAAGSGAWFVDATPLVDEEFGASGMALAGGAAVGAYDLLSAVLHEQGHVLGLADVPGTGAAVMHGLLDQGQRRTPASGAADGAVVGSVEGDAFLGGTHLPPDPATEPAPSGGTGTFSDSGQSLGNHRTSSIVMGDVDGDGDLDFVEGNNGGQSNRVWINDGQGGFADSGQALGSHNTNSVALGDVDGDGDLDFIEGSPFQGTRVWFNDGSGSFTDSGQSLGSANTQIVVVGDVDGDGDLDIIEGNRYSSNKVWVNNGLGSFTNSGQALGAHATRSVALGDLDGDGDLDLVEGNYNEANRVWLNNGSGSFSNSGQALGNHNTLTVAMGDVDGDGDLDLVEGTFGLANRVWLNNGTGTFTDSGQTLGNGNTHSTALGDMDGDGDLDLVEGNGGANRMWLNNGSGVFTDSGQALGNHLTLSVALGDVDGDGDLDLVEGNFNQANRVWINQGSGITSTTSVALDPNGNLLITDSDGGDSDDTLTLVVNGASYRITDATNRLSAGAGAVQINDHTVEVAIASVTGADGIVFDTQGGDDRVTVDLSGGAITHAIDYRAGAGSGDALAFAGTAGTAAFSFSDPQSGEVVINGGPQIAYSGLDQGIDAGLAVASLTLIYGNASETITIADEAAAGWMSVSSSEAQAIRFLNPTQSLQVGGSGGDDTVSAAGFDPAFAGTLHIDGDGGNDTVTLTAGYVLAAGRGLQVRAETIDADAGAQFITTGSGVIDLKASRRIALTGSQFSAENGGISLVTDHFDTLEPLAPGSATTGVRLDGATLTGTGSGLIDLRAAGVFDASGVVLTNGSLISSTGAVSIQGESSGMEAGVSIDGSTINTLTAIGGQVTIEGSWGGIQGIRVNDSTILAGGDLLLEGTESYYGINVLDYSARLDALGTVTLRGTQSVIGVFFAGVIGEMSGQSTNQGVIIEGASTANGGLPWIDTAGVMIDGYIYSSGSIEATGSGTGKAGITTNYGLLMSNQSGSSGAITLTGTGTETGVNLGSHFQLWSRNDLTLDGQGGAKGVRLGEHGLLSTIGDLTITGTATTGVGVSVGTGTELNAGGLLAEIRGEVTSTGTGVMFDTASVNQDLSQSSVTIVGTGGSASTDRGIDLRNSLVIDSELSLTGTTTGATGIYFDNVELHSNAGGPGDLTLDGQGGTEGVRLGAGSYLDAGQNLRISGTATAGVGVSAGIGTELKAGGLLAEILGEVTSTGTGVKFNEVSINEHFGQSSVTIAGTGGSASTNRGVELLNSLVIGRTLSLTGTTTGETGLHFENVELHSNAGGPGDLTLDGQGGTEGVHLGAGSSINAGQNLLISGTAHAGVGVSAGTGTELNAGGLLAEILGEVTSTGTGVKFSEISVNEHFGQSSVTIAGTGGSASTDRGVELLNSLVIGRTLTLTGTTTGETGLYFDDAELHSNAGGPGDLTLEGNGSIEGIHLGTGSSINAGQNLLISGTAHAGVGVSAGAGTALKADGLLAEIRGEVTSTGTGVAFDGVVVNQGGPTNPSVTITGTGGAALNDRGIDLSASEITGNGIALDGSAAGDAGIRMCSTQLYSNAGPVTMSGGSGPEGLRFEGHNVMYSEERPEITAHVVFDRDSQLDLGISGHPGTLTGQVLVNGTITIRPDATLELLPSYHHTFLPEEGQSYVIFGNDGTEPISGAFAGLAEGAAITDFLGFGLGATVSYLGGDGNDLVISTQSPNTPPTLSPIGNQMTDEGLLLSFGASGTDTDLPAQTLTYSLDAVSLAKGMTINSSSGAFLWTPGEAQSGTHTVTITVTDNGPGALSSSETFTITVNEVNQSPSLTAIENRTVAEGATLGFAVSASDGDLPAQVLTYSLDAVSLAKGMAIDLGTGAFSWTPGETQDGTHTVTITVTDNGPGLLTDSETFTITVNETNQAPVLGPIGARVVNEGSLLTFTASATDADRPFQTLTYSLDATSVAKGMSIDAATGQFAWTPTEAQSGGHTVTLTVTDDGSVSLSASETFSVTVNEVNQAPVLGPIANQATDTASSLSFAIAASDADLPAQTLTYSLDAASLAKGMGINAQTGQFTWSPTFSHGGNHTVTVTVTDSGPGCLSTTATFTIEVTVLNQPPTLSIDTAPASYTEDGAPATIAPGGLVSDLEGNWDGGTLTARISSGAVATDRLRLGGGAVTLIGGNYLQIGGITIGRANTQAALGDSLLTITFNSAATNDHVQSALRSLAFDSSSTTDPVAGPHSVSLQVTDGGGLSSATATRQIEVITVNDPPRFVDLGGNAAYLIGQGAIVLDQSSTIIDEERSAANNYAGTRLRVGRAGGADAMDTFSIAPIAGITNTGTELRDSAGQAFATYTSLGGVLEIDFTDTLGAIPTTALIQKVLQAIAYDNPSLAAGASLTIEFTFDDGEAIATGQVGLTAYDANSAGVNTDELIITTDGDGDSVQLTIADGVLRIRSADKSIIGGAGTATDANGDLYVNITGLNRIAFYLGASNDLISITNLTGFNGELIINGGDGQDEIQFGATLVAAAGRSIIFAAEEVKLNGATLETSGSGSIQIDSSGTGTDNFKGISIVNSTLRSTGSGTIEIQGEAGSLGGASQGVRLSGSSITTTGSDIRITGQGGGATSGNYGVVFESASTVSAGGSGNVTVQGTGGGGGSSSGIQLNSGSTITVMDGLLTLTGQGGGGSGNQNRGINLSGATVRATGSGSIALNGRGAGTGSTSGGVFLSGGSILTDGAGSILIQGTGSATGTNDNAGVLATNGVTLRSGSGDLVIDGQGGGTGSNNRGIYLSGAGTLVQTTTGAIRLTGRGSLTATGSYAEGILVQAASVLSSSGTIDLTGRGGTGNAHLYGVRLSGGSLSTTGTLALVGQGGTGSGIQNAGVWLFSVASTTGGALSSITGTGGTGSSKCHGVYLLAGTTTIPTSQILGTAGTGTGSLDLAGTYFT